jgi:hypothetical protein
MMDKEEVWVRFAAAASSCGHIGTDAGLIADRMLAQWSARFGDAAFLLEGQNQCGACQKPLPDGSEFTPSIDGVKFCDFACLKATGRDE